MMFLKLTREKHKYRLSISLQQIEVLKSAASMFCEGDRLKVKAKRGDKFLEVTSKEYKHGKLKLAKEAKQPQDFFITLFYDSGDKSYLEKELEIGCSILDEDNKVSKKFQKTILDISAEIVKDYTEKFALEVNVQDNGIPICKLLFSFQLQRLDDDAKSQVSVESKIARSECSLKQRRKKSASKQDLLAVFSVSNERNEWEPKSETRSNKLSGDSNQKKSNNTSAQKELNGRTSPFESPSQDPISCEAKCEVKEQIPKSTESDLKLQIYELKRKLEGKEIELMEAAKQNKGLKFTVELLMTQKSKAEQELTNPKYRKEVETITKTLIEQKLSISALEGTNKAFKQREEANEKLIAQQKKQIIYFKSLAEKEKEKMAEVMQTCLQNGNEELIGILESVLTKPSDDDY